MDAILRRDRRRGRRPAAVPDDQLGHQQRHPGRHLLASPRLPFPPDQPVDLLYRKRTDVNERLVDRGKGRPEMRGLGDVVYTDDGQLLGYADAQPMGSMEYTQRHLVITGKHGIEVRTLLKQAIKPLFAARGRPVTFDHQALQSLEPVRLQRLAPASEALLRLPPTQWAGNDPDLPDAAGHEMFCSQTPDRPVVYALSLIHISEPTRLGMISY